MGRMATRTPHIRFALLSALVIAAIAAGFGFIAVRIQTAHKEDASARATAHLAAAPLAAIFANDTVVPISDATHASADALVWQLGLGSLRSVRVSSPDGTVLYGSGDALPPPGDIGGQGAISHQRVTGGDGSALFVTRANVGGLQVEIAEDAAIVDGAIGDGSVPLLLAVAAFAFAAFALLQGAFWWGIRSFTRAHGHLEYLYDTGQELRSSLDLHDVLSRLAGDATKLMGGQYGVVALFDEETSEIMLRAAYDGIGGNVALHQRPVDEWFLRRAVATNTTVINNQSSVGFKSYFGQEAVVDGGWIICVPMAFHDRVVGAIAVLRVNAARGSYTPSETVLMEQLASQAVTAVEQAILFAKVRTDANELESSYDSTLKALMAALDAKDDVTEGHCERVAKLTIELARLMSVPEHMMVHIERGALLHDVGKIGVPDSVLNKPNSLSDSEWEAMRKHPLLAGLMVSKIGFLEPALPILLYHHERYDGTGYPFGLAGSNIPIEARIFSIVDAYDAMTSDRPYRRAMTHFAAMEEVRENAGNQFDPQVVAYFEQLMATRRDLREHTGRRVLGMHDIESPPDAAGEHVA